MPQRPFRAEKANATEAPSPLRLGQAGAGPTAPFYTERMNSPTPQASRSTETSAPTTSVGCCRSECTKLRLMLVLIGSYAPALQYRD